MLASPSTTTSSAGAYGLDTTLPAGLDADELVRLMARDKKAIDGLTFVLDGPSGVEVVAGVDAERGRGRTRAGWRQRDGIDAARSCAPSG